MKQNYTKEELNSLIPALDHAIAVTISIRKKYNKYIKMSVLRCVIFIIAMLGVCFSIPVLMDNSASSWYIGIGVAVLVAVILERIPLTSKIDVIDAINEYRAVFHQLEKDVPGIEPPVQLWSDRIIHREVCRGFVYQNQYEKEYIPKDLKQRTLLAEKKLQEMKHNSEVAVCKMGE